MFIGFRGNFDGNNHKIQEIYVNRDNYAGLFGKTIGIPNIKNLEVSGEITASEEGDSGGIHAGGIIASCGDNSYDGKIENCVNYAKVTSNGIAGGIVGNKGSSSKTLTIANCKNYGEIKGKYVAGGIAGQPYHNVNIVNCYNMANVSGGNDSVYSGISGIAGYGFSATKIVNCYNIGNIAGYNQAGGMLGYVNWGEHIVENSYNAGSVSAKTYGGILGGSLISSELLQIKNAYYLKDKMPTGIGHGPKESEANTIPVTLNEIKSQNMVDKLNEYVTENPSKYGINLKKWKLGENGYPTFEE